MQINLYGSIQIRFARCLSDRSLYRLMDDFSQWCGKQTSSNCDGANTFLEIEGNIKNSSFTYLK